jgi:hypothetical protein
MAMSEKKIGRMVTADVDKALANIDASTPKPEMGTSDELKKATGPSRDLTRGEAFKLARMKAKLAGKDPSKATFTWGGKTYHTRTAEEESRMRRAAAPKAGTTTPKAGASTPKAGTTTPKPAVRTGIAQASRTAPAAKPTPKIPAAPVRQQKPDWNKGLRSASPALLQRKEEPKPKPGSLLMRKKEEKPKPGSLLMKKAKGGKIDGVAIRGKTRAMKKGK